ncbi:MAG: tRNA (adenosine(37)-N6)-dimethylallyltransferase MiaA [Pseudomonadota bacterium]
MGPTASGKTGIAVELAQQLPVELISVDSALVFRDMNIGTAKPDAATLARAPHHLIDIIAPTESYSAAAFRHDALHLMADISARGKIPLLVGGTMLYFKALRQGLSALPQADAALRAELDAEIARHGIEQLHRQLAQVDAETAARLHPTDTQRVQRAMEIYRLSGQPMSVLIRRHTQEPLPYRILPIALIPSERTMLHQRIADRFNAMLKQGLLDELRHLRAKYFLQPNMTAMRCVGYRQAWEHLDGKITEIELAEQGIAATRQLAKRQLTWLRSMPENIVVDCLSDGLLPQIQRHIENSAITR